MPCDLLAEFGQKYILIDPIRGQVGSALRQCRRSSLFESRLIGVDIIDI
jgi:hypothetical protein